MDGNPINLYDFYGLSPNICSNDNDKKKKPKCKKPKANKAASRRAWIFYFLCKLYSKTPEDAEGGGIGSPRPPKSPKPEREVPTEPHKPAPPKPPKKTGFPFNIF